MAKRTSGDKLMSQDLGFFRQPEPESTARSARFARIMAGSALLVVTFAGSSPAGAGDDTPILARPSELPPIVSTPAPPTPTTRARPAKPSTGNRAVLALPGINAPAGPRPSTNLQPIPSSPVETPSDDGLRLDAPVEMKPSSSNAVPPSRARTSPVVDRERSPRPLTLESSDDEPLPIDTPGNRSNLMVRKPSTTPKVDSNASPLPQRRGRLFGLFPGPAMNPTPTSSPASSRASTNRPTPLDSSATAAPGRSVVEGPLPDFAADVALKKRIEKQARELVGDRARSIEVRVVGKTAVVQARGVKLFQKRNVRKSLESIPALTGLKAAVEVVD